MRSTEVARTPSTGRRIAQHREAPPRDRMLARQVRFGPAYARRRRASLLPFASVMSALQVVNGLIDIYGSCPPESRHGLARWRTSGPDPEQSDDSPHLAQRQDASIAFGLLQISHIGCHQKCVFVLQGDCVVERIEKMMTHFDC